MANQIFNIAKGAFVEKFRDSATVGIVGLMQAAEADATLNDYDELDALFTPAGNTESTATNYARKTGLTGTVVVDDSNEWAEVRIADQVFSSLGPGSALVKVFTAYEESAAETGRIPISHHDISATPDGTDLTVDFTDANSAVARATN